MKKRILIIFTFIFLLFTMASCKTSKVKFEPQFYGRYATSINGVEYNCVKVKASNNFNKNLTIHNTDFELVTKSGTFEALGFLSGSEMSLDTKLDKKSTTYIIIAFDCDVNESISLKYSGKKI